MVEHPLALPARARRSAAPAPSASTTRSSRIPRAPFTSTRSPGFTRPRPRPPSPPRRRIGGRARPERPPRAPALHPRRRSPRRRARRPAARAHRLLVERLAVLPELEHVPEHGAPLARGLDRPEERQRAQPSRRGFAFRASSRTMAPFSRCASSRCLAGRSAASAASAVSRGTIDSSPTAIAASVPHCAGRGERASPRSRPRG